MNDHIIQDLRRIRELFGLLEQTNDQSLELLFKENNPTSIKQFLLDNESLKNKLEELFSTTNLDDLTTKIMNPNNTIIMRGLQRSSMSKDMEMYEFLDILSKSKS